MPTRTGGQPGARSISSMMRKPEPNRQARILTAQHQRVAEGLELGGPAVRGQQRPHTRIEGLSHVGRRPLVPVAPP